MNTSTFFKVLPTAFILAAILPQARAATIILDELSVAGDFDGAVGEVQWSNFSGGWFTTGSRNPGYATTTDPGRPAGASAQYMRTIDHRRSVSLDLGYATVGTAESYNISFYAYGSNSTNAIEHGSDYGELILYYTSDNSSNYNLRVSTIVLKGYTADALWTQASVSAAGFAIDPGAGKNLYLRYAKNSDGDNVNDEFIGADNISVSLVTAVPEPRSLILGALSGLMVLRRRRR